MTKKICRAAIAFADDHGDNEATFYCKLPEGHPGKHRETGIMYKKLPYTLEWEGSMKDLEQPENEDSKTEECKGGS